MIAHLATFTWRAGVMPEQVEGLTRDLYAMASDIPVLLRYTCGAALRIRDGGTDYGVVAILREPDDVHTYLGHVRHAEVQARWLDDMVAERRAVQLLLPDGFVTP